MIVKIIQVKKTDNFELAALLRKILIEMGVPKKGTAFEDPEIDCIYETYNSPRTKYFIIEEDAIIKGAGGELLQVGNKSPLLYNKSNLLNPEFIAGNIDIINGLKFSNPFKISSSAP